MYIMKLSNTTGLQIVTVAILVALLIIHSHRRVTWPERRKFCRPSCKRLQYTRRAQCARPPGTRFHITSHRSYDFRNPAGEVADMFCVVVVSIELD